MAKIPELLKKVADQEVWLVGGLVVASLLDERLLPLCILVGMAFWALRWIAFRRATIRTSADWSNLVIVLSLPVAMAVSAMPQVSRTQIFRLLSGMLLYYAIVNWAVSIRRLRWAVLGTLLAGVFLSVFALVSVEWAVRKWLNLAEIVYQSITPWRLDSVNPNVMAGNLVLILPLAIGGVFSSWGRSSWLWRLISAGSALVITGILVLTLSRGALLALALALVIFVAIRWRWGWILLMLSAIGAGFLAYRIGPYTLLESLLSGTSVGSLESRVDLWSRAVLLARDFPFTGVGMGMAGEAIARLMPISILQTNPIAHVHNLYLQVYLDLGFVGFMGWVATMMLSVLTAWKIYKAGMKSWRAGWIAGIGAGLFCSQVALIFHGATDAVTWGMVRPAPLVWALWGLVMAMGNATLQQPPQSRIELEKNQSNE